MATPTMKETKKVDITSLMSPPDPVLDSFHAEPHQNINIAKRAQPSAEKANQPAPLSPPVSPRTNSPHATSAERHPSIASQNNLKDPFLYPIEDASSTILQPGSSQPPLFAPTEIEENKRILDDHIQNRSQIFDLVSVSPPKREDYELMITFRACVMGLYTQDRSKWLRTTREQLKADNRVAAGKRTYQSIMPAKPRIVTPAKSARAQRTDRISKPQQPNSRNNAPRPIRSSGAGVSPTNPGRRSVSRASATPEPSKRVVAPNREDKDFNSLPDYCPPVSSLPDRPNSLKVDWKGQPIDLSGDVHVHLLHPDEVGLAGNLRLDCATYLTSKRRIFERRLQCLRTGKEFRKTDAQQACKIDVNKASKLWQAFEKVGWLEAKWVRQYL
ncbi:unnamed protein product [Clonostachys byssicola]|uniref:SWIRM domain-containing protein n=1 Tax=Clonostachys byssicola TaxID=160290 RepID=A0A9N9Y3J9_9HYPO|nr:unnamed protein product [Clonostachys byssicola]